MTTKTYTINAPGARTLAEARRYLIDGKPVTVEVTDTTVTIMVGCTIAHIAPRPAGLDNIAAVADYAIATLTAPAADENGVTVEESRWDTRLHFKHEGAPLRTIIQNAEPYDIVTTRHAIGSGTCLHCYSASTTSIAKYTWESYRPAGKLGRARLDRISVCAKHAKAITAK